MDENSKQNDTVTEILDAAFNKDWDDFSPEEYKHQLAETQAEVKKLTPDKEKTKTNRRMNLRVQATGIYRRDRHGSRATRKRYFQAFCYACDYLADTCNLQKVSNITPTHFRKVTEYWKSYKAPSTIQTELSGFRKYCEYAGCKHKMPENKELKLPKREPKKYNRGWLVTEYQKARELAESMNRFDVRDGFNRMIADALDGKIDLIVTKSVSRFARNTVDSLTTVRKLKDKGVEVYFEKENIWTMDSKGELLITIMSSLAQEESRSISENVTWGQRKRFADGKVSMPYKHFLGYKKGADGLPEIVESEAEVVRNIYRMFMEGMSTNAIARHLTDAGIPTPSKKAKWLRQTVESILTNEKYKGSALLQKKYTVDFLQKKMKVNEGEVPQYYVEHSHPAIIEPEEWERVQNEFNRRKNSDRRTLCNSPFAGKMICGDCGEIFGSKVWHSNSKYRRTIWQCNAKFKGDNKCKTPHLYEDDIKEMFVIALSKLMKNREALLEDGRLIYTELSDTADIDKKCNRLLDEIDVTKELIAKLIKENAVQAQNQEDYLSRYETLAQRHDKHKGRYENLQQKRERRLYQADSLSAFLFALKELDMLNIKWTPNLWHTTVDKVIVNADGSVEFHFKNGSEVEV